MAVQFRNLQGGNPYQGIADTMERVSSRVGASWMAYGDAVRKRNEDRDRLKAEKEKSMVDAIVKLVPAAAGYEMKKDAIAYGKEQDKLDRQFKEGEAERAADYRESMLKETIRGRKVSEKLAEDTRQYQSERAKAQDSQWDRMFSLTEDKARKDDAWRVIQGTWRQDDLNRQKELSRLELEHKGKILGFQEKRLDKTALEQAKDSAYIASLETKGKKGLKDRLSRSYAHFYGASYGIEGTDTYIPENPSAPGWDENKKGLDGEVVGGPKVSEDEYFKQLGYGGGTADKAFLPTTTEEVFMRYASEDAKNSVGLRPEILADVEPSQEDQHRAEINEGMLREGAIAGHSATGADDDLNFEETGSVLEIGVKKDPSKLEVSGTTGRADVAKIMSSGSIEERKARYSGMTAEQLRTAMSREDISSSEKALISDVLANLGDTSNQGSSAGKLVASEVAEAPQDTRVYSENTIMKKDDEGNIVPDQFKMVTTSKGGNINVRSGPEVQPKEANVISKLKKGTEVTVTGYQGDWMYVKFNDAEGEEVTGWIKNTGLKNPTDSTTKQEKPLSVLESGMNNKSTAMDLSPADIVQPEEPEAPIAQPEEPEVSEVSEEADLENVITKKKTSPKVKREVFSFTGNIGDLLGERPKYRQKKITIKGKQYLEITEEVSGLKVRERMSGLGTQATRDTAMLSLRSKIIQRYQKKK